MSLSNKKWEIGIAVPIENYNFRYRNRFTGTGDLSGGTVDMTVSSFTTDAGESNLENIFSPSAFDEYVSIKNSSGEVCSKKISSVNNSASTIELDSTVDSNFEYSGLELFGYGKNMPGGWFGGTSGRVVGDVDNFGTWVEVGNDIKQTLDSDYFFTDQTYRLTIVCARDDTDHNGRVKVCNSSDTATMIFTDGITSTDYTFDSKAGSTSDSTEFAEIRLESGKVSEIGLECAYNPNVNKTISSDGYYEFEDWPSQGSVEWDNRATLQSIDKYNSGISLYDVTGEGERNEKLTISASFTNAPLSLFTTLREFLRVQNNGYSLNLHPYGYSELPKIVTGYLVLENVSRESWNLSLVDFDMIFKEK